MIRIVASFSLVLVHLIASCLLGQAGRQWKIDDYLHPADLYIRYSDILYEEPVRTALLKLDVAQNANQDEIMARLKSLVTQVDRPIGKDIYQALFNLADETSKCDKQLLFDAEVMYALRNTPELQPFQRFMSVVGGNKMAHCAKIMTAEINQRAKTRYERRFDEFYTAAFGLGSEASDTELIEKLADFDIAHDKLDLLESVEVVRKYTVFGDDWDELVLIPIDFIDRTCGTEGEVGYLLTAANLAKAYQNYELKSEQLRKLNEYNRICNAFSALTVGAIREHFEALLEETESWSVEED